MRRRQLLASIAVGGGAVLSGCQELLPSDDSRTPTREGSTPTARPTTNASSTDEPTATRPTPTEEPAFGTVVDMVEDRGVDPEGGEPIDDALRRAAADDTVLEFPPGEYLVTKPLFLREATNFGIRGTGKRHRDVRFVHPKGYSGILLNVRDGTDCLIENVTADQTPDRETNTGIVFRQRDGLRIRDVEVAGFTPTESDSPDQRGSINLIPQVTTPDGVGTVERFTSTGGGEVGVYPNSYPGLYSGKPHRGTLRLLDCHVEDCGGTGVYASRTFGPVQIEGGRFRNNEVAQVRISGKGSYIRNAEIVVDTANSRNSRGSYQTVRGLWWESGNRGKTGGFVENCTFVARTAPIRRGLLEVDGTGGAMTVRNSEFRTNRNRYYAINASPPGSSQMGGEPAKPWGITLKNVRVNGRARNRVAVRIDGRPGSNLDGVRIEQPAAGRDGVVLRQSPGCRIENSTIDVNQFPLRLPLGSALSDAQCRLELANDTEVRSATVAASDALPGDPISLQVDPESPCLPSLGVDSGTLVVVGKCAEGFVGGIVGADSKPDETATETNCV